MILTFTQWRDITGMPKILDESRKFTPFLNEAQFELKKMLGTTLYDELDTAIANSFSGEADLATLFDDYVKRPLAWRTLQHALPRLFSEPTANGVHTVSDTNYAPVDRVTLASQVAQARDFADKGYDEMLRYLCDNTATFTTYETNVGTEERVTKTFPGGVITRKSRWSQPYGLKGYHPYEGSRNTQGECCPDE